MHRAIVAVEGISQVMQQRIADIAQKFNSTVSFHGQNHPDWTAITSEADVLFGWPPPEALYSSSIRFLQLPSSGYDAYNTPALSEKPGFILANSRGVVADAVAEHCLALMFALTRHIPFHSRQQSLHHWERVNEYTLLSCSTVAILGMGAIGTTLARKCHALGMNVISVQRDRNQIFEDQEVCNFDSLDSALSRADHVVLTMAALPENAALFTEERFRRMRQESCFYNLGRGSLVDETALLTALRHGHIKAAALDVFAQEPLPSSSPLWDLPNLLITPHVGGRFAGEIDALAQLFATNFERYAQGKHPVNVVLGSLESATIADRSIHA